MENNQNNEGMGMQIYCHIISIKLLEQMITKTYLGLVKSEYIINTWIDKDNWNEFLNAGLKLLN